MPVHNIVDISEYKRYHTFDFSDGADIAPEEIENWKRSCLKYLEEHPSTPYIVYSSGKMMVVAWRIEDGVEIITISNYKRETWSKTPPY